MPRLTFPDFPDERALRAIERRGLNLKPSGSWQEVWQNQHQTAFTVAQSAGYDILSDIYNALLSAMRNRVPFEDFRQDLEPVLQAKGWWGKREDGVYLGTPWRLKTIFQTNLRVSAAQGDWEVIQELKGDMPYLRYVAVLDSRTRPLHASWNDIVLPVDHPWWKTHFPPNGWNCRCKTLLMDDDDLGICGLSVSENAPDDGSREWINRATGEVLDVPNGIDPGWAYNPGAVDQAACSAKLAMDRLAELPPRMGAQAIARLALSFPQVERELKSWIYGITASIASGIFRPTGARRIVGALPDEAIDYAEKIGVKLETGAISIGDRDLMHALRTDKVEPLPIEFWNSLPSLLLDPDAIYWDKFNDDLLYLFDDGTSKIVIQLNNSEEAKNIINGKRKKKKIITNTVRSGRRIQNTAEYERSKRFEQLKKKGIAGGT